jgi:uncharacterized protein with NAD-binding domain and iron-sulfur cluster
MSRVLIVGGGIAGMSTAMELAADHDVTVIERRAIAGGKARTWVNPDHEVFQEHSFRVFHGTYENTFDTMRRVPTGPGRTILDDLQPFVSRRDLQETGTETVTRWLRTYSDERPVDAAEVVRLTLDGARLLRALTASDERLRRRYGSASFESLFLQRPSGDRGLLFQGLRDMSQVEYSSDRVNPDVKVMLNFVEKHFLHGLPGLAWRALVGPTSDTYIEPWRQHLVAVGVNFRTEHDAVGVELGDDGRVAGVAVTGPGGRTTTEVADHYVLAVPTDVLSRLVDRTLDRAVSQLRRVRSVRRVWNNGAIIYTSKPTRVAGGFYLWHPWRVAVTSYADRWRLPYTMDHYGLGEDRGRIKDIISYVITDWFTDGIATGKPASDCTPDEIYEELCWMGLEDKSVMPTFDPSDHVHPLNRDGQRVTCLVDPALVYDDSGRIVHNEDTLAHLPPGYSLRMPGAATDVDNLYLAGCHCYNAFGCGDSMEGANETGRRAANAILDREGDSRRASVMEGRRRSPAVRALQVARGVDAVGMAARSQAVRLLPGPLRRLVRS